MKIQSLIRDGDVLVRAEVEVMLMSGLPQIQILGLPDQVIKESLHRIRCALKVSGFQWPQAQQIIVNIRPIDRKKTSRGLDLAIAAGLLWESGQLPKPETPEALLIYGELTLSGEVIEPEDLEKCFPQAEDMIVLTGQGESSYIRDRVKGLSELCFPSRDHGHQRRHEVIRPELGLTLSYSEADARLLSLAALSGAHLLMAGAGGAGKTTLARALLSFLTPPTESDLKHGYVDKNWRPWVAPHHTSSALALVGGGVPPKRGEISRAHRGLLFLDELLEFPKAVQEALREPIESGMIRVSRGQSFGVFPAQFQLIATTNLCPCGRWAPGEKISCGRSWKRCRSVVDRVSGPFFDRFELLVFMTRKKHERTVQGRELYKKIESVREFIDKELREPKNEADQASQLTASAQAVVEHLCSELSERRKIATLKIARALSSLDYSAYVEPKHIDEAMEWTQKSFDRLHSAAGV